MTLARSAVATLIAATLFLGMESVGGYCSDTNCCSKIKNPTCYSCQSNGCRISSGKCVCCKDRKRRSVGNTGTAGNGDKSIPDADPCELPTAPFEASILNGEMKPFQKKYVIKPKTALTATSNKFKFTADLLTLTTQTDATKLSAVYPGTDDRIKSIVVEAEATISTSQASEKSAVVQIDSVKKATGNDRTQQTINTEKYTV